MEQTTLVTGLPSWQVLAIVFSVVGIVFAGVTVALLGIMRSINEYQNSINETIKRGTEEHKEWRVEMPAINEKVSEWHIEREVERRLRERQPPAAGV